jgi:Ankyrin repeats (many copies)
VQSGGLTQLYYVRPLSHTPLSSSHRSCDDSPLFMFSVRSLERAPLYYAALCGFHDMAEYLIIKHRQEVNANGGIYVSPLGQALAREHLDVAQLLYQHGADVDVQSDFGRTPLTSAAGIPLNCGVVTQRSAMAPIQITVTLDFVPHCTWLQSSDRPKSLGYCFNTKWTRMPWIAMV